MTPSTVRDNLKALSAYLYESSGPDFMFESVEQAIALLVEREWRGIESAPKDGTPIIIAGRYPNGVSWVEEGRWQQHTKRFSGPIEGPTHWMPLPEPPK